MVGADSALRVPRTNGTAAVAQLETAAFAQLLSVPYPYEGMLAICSDLDETPNARIYAEISRFLNTREITPMGEGVGLEVGNTIYFDMPHDQFSYWGTDDRGRSMLHDCMHSGHIDCLHSFGDLACTRQHACRALEQLAKRECRLETWVDHAAAPTNFGSDIMRGRGDVTSSDCYHADLTLDYGIKYVWRGRVTSVIAQDTRRLLSGLWHPAHPIASAKTVFKEFAKGAVGRLRNNQYTMHKSNRITVPARLRDGRRIHEFLRCDPYWGGVGRAATADGIADVLTESFLSQLVSRRGAAIVYTHLGKTRDPGRPFSIQTCRAFRRLAEYAAQSHILVLTTTRLLRYVTTRDHLSWRASELRDQILITIDSVNDPLTGVRDVDDRDIAGLSFQVQSRKPVLILLASGRELRPRQVPAYNSQIAYLPFAQLVHPPIDAGLLGDIA